MADVQALNEPVNIANQDAGQQQQQQQPFTWGRFAKNMLFQMLIMYAISSFFRGSNQPKSATNSSSVDGHVQKMAKNLMPKSSFFDLYIFISEEEGRFNDFNNSLALFWYQPNIQYGDWHLGPNGDGTFVKHGEIECSENVQNNGSIYLHVFITKPNRSPDPSDSSFSKRLTIYKLKRLNRYRKKRYQKTQNLLTGKTEASIEQQLKADTIKAEILSHWHPNLTLNLIDDHTQWPRGNLPPPLDEAVEFDPVSGDYYPILFFNDYWNLATDYQPINDTVKKLNLTLTYAPMSLFKWQLYSSQQMRNKWSSMLGADFMEESDEDQDSLKQAILETNPYLLGLTIFVSILHTIFEFLAFKNDIQFWRSRKSLEGLSVRSVVFNVFTSLIVLLYILDNETNFVVRISVGIGLLIELWKIPKVLDVKLDRENKVLGIFPRIKFCDKGSYVASSTKQYDQMAFKYLSWFLYPLLGGYVVYSLYYHEHRGWYSFILSMLYGFLLTFGFIMMTPQLFINYKLKSVAHLPWRMLTYKFLNTFIDDIFAFVIRMPTMYRLGCFRDDIVFLIYLYQRWIYRVDPSRMNEFGTTGEGVEQAAIETSSPDDGNDDALPANGDLQDNLENESPVEPTTPDTLRRRVKGVEHSDVDDSD